MPWRYVAVAEWGDYEDTSKTYLIEAVVILEERDDDEGINLVVGAVEEATLADDWVGNSFGAAAIQGLIERPPSLESARRTSKAASDLTVQIRVRKNGQLLYVYTDIGGEWVRTGGGGGRR